MLPQVMTPLCRRLASPVRFVMYSFTVQTVLFSNLSLSHTHTHKHICDKKLLKIRRYLIPTNGNQRLTTNARFYLGGNGDSMQLVGEGILGAAVEISFLWYCEIPDCQDTSCRIIRFPIASMGFKFDIIPVPFVPDEQGKAKKKKKRKEDRI